MLTKQRQESDSKPTKRWKQRILIYYGIRREAKDGDPHPLRLTGHEEEFYAVQAKRADILLDGKKFSAMIVSGTGRMALMNTISPVVFAKFKRWMAGQDNREPMKRQRDMLQAELVEEMVAEFFPNLM